MNRTDLLNELVKTISSVSCSHPIRVALDGIDTSGKTTLADELVQPVQDRGYVVIRASIDRFHLPQTIRHQRGSLSPEGYYYDSFDYEAIKSHLLEPLGENGSRHYCREMFDYRNNRAVEGEWQVAEDHSILIMDGVFLQRPEINAYWDLRIWVDIPFELALERALQRDMALFGTAETVRERYTKRYMPGQKLYFELCRPQTTAQLVIENSDPLHPRLYRTAS